MQRNFLVAIIQAACVLAACILLIGPSAAAVFTIYTYTGPQFSLSRVCTVSDCGGIDTPAFDSVQGFVQFDLDTSKVSRTFSVGGFGGPSALVSSDGFGATLNGLGSITLSAGEIAGWSLFATQSSRTAFITLTSSDAGDSSSFQFPVFDPVTQDLGFLSGKGSGPPGVWSGPMLFGETETPIPTALALFVTGLGAFGLLGWRGKRKDHAKRRMARFRNVRFWPFAEIRLRSANVHISG